MLEVTDLILKLPRPDQAASLSFRLTAGKILWVRGQNGAGKSTLLKTLLGWVPAQAGSVHWKPHRPPIFYLGHELSLQPSLTLLEYCRWHPSALTLLSDQECLSALAEVGLLSEAHRLCGQLSRGQGQRLLMACALLSRAPLWFLDEPLTALDMESRAVLMDKLQAHRAQGGAALVVSHSPLEALADGVIDVMA